MCELTAAINGIQCDEAGGVDTWYMFPRFDAVGVSTVDTLTIVAGEATALTLVIGKNAFPVTVEQETSSVTDTAIGERANGSYGREQAATLMLHGNGVM